VIWLSEERDLHDDLGVFLLGSLSPAERERFESHLRGCDDCCDELSELSATGALLRLALPPDEPPERLRARSLAAGGQPAANGRAARPPRRRFRLRFALGLPAATATVAVALVAIALVLRGGPPGTLELDVTLTSPAGGAVGQAEVRRTGIGRVIGFRSDSLPLLPRGELYELWFVGPGDLPGRPDRISAGTFHPDGNGRTDVTLAAAADPAQYPVLVVTAEPGDGDPQPSGVDVLRSASG
jgi:anti-sigma-K factor RskA